MKYALLFHESQEHFDRRKQPGLGQMIAHMAGFNFLKVPARVSDTAKAAALLACDRFRMMTGTVVNSTAGAATLFGPN